VGEYAEVHLVPVSKILERMAEFKEQGYGIDGKIWMIGYGLQLSQRLSSTDKISSSAKNKLLI
jgi:hypothetical protein